MSQQLTQRLLVLAWITAQRQLIHDKTASRTAWNQSYDFIVVGAGTAGCAIANRLSSFQKVLLLEAGGPQSAIYNDMPGLATNITVNQWEYYNEPVRNAGKGYPTGRIPEFKGKTLGGSSAHNGMIFNRGNRRGFDNWAKIYGAKGWSYAEVLPYFKRWENNTDERIVRANPGYHGTSGPVQITSPKYIPKILRELKNIYNGLGIRDTDINGVNQTGIMFSQMFIDSHGVRAGSGNAYIDPNPFPNNLHIVTKALVIKILFNGLTAMGVEFIKNDKSYKVFANNEVIISGGAINSPQLLMLSGIGPKEHLIRWGIPVILDLPVGNNFMNHPTVRVRLPSSPLLRNRVPQLNEQQLTEFYLRNSGPLAYWPMLVAYFSTKNNRDEQWPNLELVNLFEGSLFCFCLSLVRVLSRGTVRLQSTNPYIPPLINSNFLDDSQDFEDAVEGLRFMFYVLEKTSMSQYSRAIDPVIEAGCNICPNKYVHQCTDALRCFVRKSSGSVYHVSGSCRMGSVDRTDVVVDEYLRVKNAHKLRVCDASVFPEIPNSNTNSAANMVGEKCAQIITDCYHLND